MKSNFNQFWISLLICSCFATSVQAQKITVKKIKELNKASTPPTPQEAGGIAMKKNLSTAGFRYMEYVREEVKRLEEYDELQERRDSLELLLKNTKITTNIITARNYDEFISAKFRGLSGTEIKNGKFVGSSAAVDEKSVTLNFSIKPSKDREFYIQPTISGKSDNGLVDLFSEGKRNKTITYGLNFTQLIAKNSSKYWKIDKYKLHNDIRDKHSKFDMFKEPAEKLYLSTRVAELKKLYDGKLTRPMLDQYAGDVIVGNNLIMTETLAVYKKAADTLIGAGLLPKSFLSLKIADQASMIETLNIEDRINAIVLANHLDKMDKLQLNAPFNSSTIKYVSGGIKHNKEERKIFDPTSTTLTRDYLERYPSANFALTLMRTTKNGNRIYFSPTINYSNPKDFVKDDEITTQVEAPKVIGSTTVQNITAVTFYEKVPSYLNTIYFDVPFVYYNVKKHMGFEVGFKGGWDDPDDDLVSVRLGLLIPINPDSDSQLMIEPLIRFKELNNKVTKLWKNNFVFGVNVSLAFPKNFFNKDK
ncbi:hypothetical protein [Pedobacter frigiditerrae]|uniref:hypothetical protein n=1 Tax=Pedobacter frigiditerrae TaxID=2530452 RepID=UPI0029306A06|nr:hypothetical protein [Pedobacter frigiditerrae]